MEAVPTVQQKTITCAALTRLARRAGIVSISETALESLRSLSEERFVKMLGKLMIVMEYERKKTLTADIIVETFGKEGRKVYKIGNTIDSVRGKAKTKKTLLAKLKFYQSTDNLLVPKASFSRFVRSRMETDIRFTPEAMDLLQYEYEKQTVAILSLSQQLALFSDRKRVMEKDVEFVRENKILL